MDEFLERAVLKRSLVDDRPAWERASPIHRIHADAPPFFVIHGTHDSLAPVSEARRFVAKLRDNSKAPVAYAELMGAQHAFEVFHSVRTRHVVRGVERFLAWAVSRHRATGSSAAAERSASA
jgi:acetyl esterase/lipase